jgi:DNA invertase Pin-like site-specific DNA recombinase
MEQERGGSYYVPHSLSGSNRAVPDGNALTISLGGRVTSVAIRPRNASLVTSTDEIRRLAIVALAHAKAIGATVVFAKLDRLTRNVDLLRSLVASNVDLVFCDLPHVPPGAMGRFLLTQMASVAELEAGLISERTKAALAAAKRREARQCESNHAKLSTAHRHTPAKADQILEIVRVMRAPRSYGFE